MAETRCALAISLMRGCGRYLFCLIVDVDDVAVIFQTASQIAARAIHESRWAAFHGAEVCDLGFVVNMAERMQLWLDAFFDVLR